MEAVEVGCADTAHLGCMVGLQRREERLADVEVSVLQFTLKPLKSDKNDDYDDKVLHLEHEPELVLLLGGAPVDAGGVQQTRHLVHLVPRTLDS